MRHLMSPLDLSVDELNTLLDLASDIEKHPDKYAHVCDDKRLATLFYEPSTLSLIHISEPTRRTPISYAVFCLKKKKIKTIKHGKNCQKTCATTPIKIL